MRNCSNVKEIVSGAAHAGCEVLVLVDAIDTDDGIQPSTGAPLMDNDDVLRGMFNLYLICHIFYSSLAEQRDILGASFFHGKNK